jgi:beta-N-acetylhexosaminidase
MRAFITGLAGPVLTDEERGFLRDAQPWGLILFKRNVTEAAALRRLIEDARTVLARNAPVLIDQEGGRVQRLGPPHWPAYPPGAAYGSLYERDCNAGLEAARLGARLIAADLLPLGIDVDCLPICDVLAGGPNPAIEGRSYGREAGQVSAIGAAVARGLAEGGVLPVVKHMPGHGRATVDSHHKLPVVNADRVTLDLTDFAAFRPLATLPLGMTAHVVFSAIDPIAPATISATIVRDVIRDSLGFKGLLMTDDISMSALSGSVGERARAALAAGCDVALHCNGEMTEMREVAAEAPLLAGEAQRRADAALAARKPPDPFDVAAGRAQLLSLMTGVWQPAQGLA